MTRCLLSLMIVFAALSVSAKGKVPAEKDMAGSLILPETTIIRRKRQ